MSGRLIAAGIVGVLSTVPMAWPCAAGPPDGVTECALFFTAKAQKLATINGQLYPYQWYRQSISKAAVILTLVVTGPSTATYKGFQCTLAKDGSITGGSSPY